MSEFKAAFSAACGTGMIDIEGPTAKYTDEVFDQNALPKGLSVAILINPFHDSEMERFLHNYFIPKKNSQIFIDSGGYQLIRGIFKGDKTEFKEKVYNLMAKYADYAFCFDENPLDKNSVYCHERVIPAVLETNKNIKRQIEVFKEKGSKAKVLPIFQVKEDDRHKAIDLLFDGVDLKYIAGIALNKLVWGGNGTEDFGKLAFFNEVKKAVKIPNMLHLLSYGLLRVVTPFIILQRFGYFGEDNIFSADSSLYVQGMRRWGWVPLLDGSGHRVAGAENPTAWAAFKEYAIERIPELKDRIKDIDHTNTRTNHPTANLLSTCFMMVAKNAYINLFSDPVSFALKYQYLTEAQITSLKELSRTNTFQDYQKWREDFGVLWNGRRALLNSKEGVKNTLDAFF